MFCTLFKQLLITLFSVQVQQDDVNRKLSSEQERVTLVQQESERLKASLLSQKEEGRERDIIREKERQIERQRHRERERERELERQRQVRKGSGFFWKADREGWEGHG